MKSTIPFEKIIEPGTLTVFRLSKADLPSDFRELLTNTFVMKLYFLA